MYVLTFYSFKGGVGRTLALVNVAADLASKGKSVLLVDFDLEAPGLDGFPDLHAAPNTPGIVEFVTEYLRTGIAPNALDYIARCDVPRIKRGALSLMRSGLTQSDYSARLREIDWQTLYSNHDGYLLFEDLKAQWKRDLNPDYVLIDSRTGHTDVGGICTRQLPNAVVACFIPNEENIKGLETIIAEIRKESTDLVGRSIELHFVASNVPYIDDENGILENRLEEAKRRFGLEHPPAIIHRYESLSLLNSEIFVLSRERSRLAKEYRALTKEITAGNFEDRDVALRTLSRASGWSPHFEGGRSPTETMERIQVLHADDGETLYALYRIVARLGRESEAQSLLKRVKALGFTTPEIILETAHEDVSKGSPERAVKSVEEALGHSAFDYFTLTHAVRLLVQQHPSSLVLLKQSPAFLKLPSIQQATLCEGMLVSRECLPIAEEVLRFIVHRPGADPRVERTTRGSMIICVIGQGRFGDAMLLISKERPAPSGLVMTDAFNYAMAEWGITHQPPVDMFSRVLQLAKDLESGELGKNVSQCVAIAACVVGDGESAMRFLRRADMLASDDSSETFSGWRYLQVGSSEFLADLTDIRSMLNGESIVPEILSEYWHKDTPGPGD